MKTIALWAINGIGLGHTSRISLVAKELKRYDVNVKFIVEHPPQENYLRLESHTEPILKIPRPWKLPLNQKHPAETAIKDFLSNIDGFIGDMGSIPQMDNIGHLIPSHIKPVFLLRWVSKKRWEPIAERIKNFENAEAIIVSPQIFFEKLTEININSTTGIEGRVNFINGFIFHEPVSLNEYIPTGKTRIAFCCGSGGVHSEKGLIELEEVIKGLYLTKKLLGEKILIDAWIGSNEQLGRIASQYNIFEQIGGINTNIMPCWNNYDLVVGRCGYNTFLEVMNSRALFVTGAFESDGEWNQENLEKLSDYGVVCLPKINSESIFSAVSSTFSTNRIIEEIIMKRKNTFKNGLESLIFTLKRVITNPQS